MVIMMAMILSIGVVERGSGNYDGDNYIELSSDDLHQKMSPLNEIYHYPQCSKDLALSTRSWQVIKQMFLKITVNTD